jgi:phosphoribosylanthranilate isomerase
MAELVPVHERLTQLFARGGVIKICGLRDPEHAAAAAAAGADLIGFIFAPARRQITPGEARSCIAAAREVAPGREFFAVGVFVDAPLSEMACIAQESGVDAIQLHGSETPESLQLLTLPVLKAFRPRPGIDAAHVVTEINRYRSSSKPPVGVLIDGYADGVPGGTGARADWRRAKEIGAALPFLLAGGLDPENVAAAIREVRPLGVDVSSGVEIEGAKDTGRIEIFIHAARAAFHS